MIALEEETMMAFRNHALRESPREACGFVAVVKGKQQYYECRNIAEGNNDFILDPQDHIYVEDLVLSHAGDITHLLHSHPATDCTPSMADKVGCELSGLAWGIHSLKTGDWNFFAPTGYKAPLIGRPWRHGIFDCYSAMRDWFKEKKGIELLDFERQPRWWDKGEDLFMENFRKAGFVPVMYDGPQIGDVILFNYHSPIVNHCAVYIGNDQVFHQCMNRLSSREIYGGWLKKNTRMIVRYQK